MSRAKIKGNVVTYSIRFLSLIYLIPICVLCGITWSLKWVFINLDKIASYLSYKPMGIISKSFPFKVDSNDK